MWQTISANSGALNVVLNAVMVAVWAVYLHLILSGYRREVRPRILINRSAGHDLDANCVVTNMSREAIYIDSVCLTFWTAERHKTRSLADLSSLTRRPDADPRAFWFQGPVASSEYLLLGSFRQLLGDLLGVDDAALERGEITAFEVVVVATYGPDKGPVGARRRFRRKHDDPDAWTADPTHQMSNWRERRRLRALLPE